MAAEIPKPDHASGRLRSAVAVVGGGLAGLAAAALASQHGLKVELFERRARLGGRADSFVDPSSGRLIDYCQHVGLGCCRVLADFCRRTGVADCFEAFADIHLISSDGRRFDLRPSRRLPAPCHLLPSLLRLRYLSRGERLAILRAAQSLRRSRPSVPRPHADPTAAAAPTSPAHPTSPADSSNSTAAAAPESSAAAEQTIDRWLRAQGQSRRAIEQFWSLILLSALAETPEHIAFSAGARVLGEGLFGSRTSHALLVPRMPLGEIFERRVGRWLEGRGVVVHRSALVEKIERSPADDPHAVRLHLGDRTTRQFDFAVVAVPPRQLAAMLPGELRRSCTWLEHLGGLPAAGITAVHLWFDRPVLALPQVALVGHTSQWVFVPEAERTGGDRNGTGGAPSSESQDLPAAGESYCQVVISASHRLLSREPQQTVERVLDEMRAVLPGARRAVLRRWRVINRPSAVLALRPGVEAQRPRPAALRGPVVVAGDWTATGWPATMESAVRSGYAAVEAVLKMCGRPVELLGAASRARWPQLGE